MIVIFSSGVVKEFRGSHSFLSNFHPSTIIYEGLVFPTVENAYQAAKCFYKEDMVKFMVCGPSRAKKLGREIINILPDWNERKVTIMRKLLEKKFAILELRQMLLATGTSTLEEGNYWGDTFWGICQGKGQNMLGKLLMEIRAEINEQISKQLQNPPSDEVPI